MTPLLLSLHLPPLPQLLQDGLAGFTGLQRLTVTLAPDLPGPEAAAPMCGAGPLARVQPAGLRARLVESMRAELAASLKVALPAQAVRVVQSAGRRRREL